MKTVRVTFYTTIWPGQDLKQPIYATNVPPERQMGDTKLVAIEVDLPVLELEPDITVQGTAKLLEKPTLD